MPMSGWAEARWGPTELSRVLFGPNWTVGGHSRVAAIPGAGLRACERSHYNRVVVVAQLFVFLALCCAFVASVMLPEMNLLARLYCGDSLLCWSLLVSKCCAVFNLVDSFKIDLGLTN